MSTSDLPTPKTYKCPNPNCPHYKQNLKRGRKKKKVLLKGVIVDPSWVVVRCDSCGSDLHINMTKKEEIVVDKTPVNVLDILRAKK